jgi:hypothetical protein
MIATDDDNPSRLIKGPLPRNGGTAKYSPVSTPPTARYALQNAGRTRIRVPGAISDTSARADATLSRPPIGVSAPVRRGRYRVPMNDQEVVGNIRVHGQTYDEVAVAPSPMFPGWVRVTFLIDGQDRTYHIPSERVDWFMEGAGKGPLT